MKKILLIAVIGVLLIAGCEFLPGLRDSIRNQAKNTTTNVIKKVDEVGNQIQKTKDSVQQKVEDVQNMVKKVGETVDAVKKVTGVSDNGTSTANGTSSAK